MKFDLRPLIQEPLFIIGKSVSLVLRGDHKKLTQMNSKDKLVFSLLDVGVPNGVDLV